MCRLLQVSQSGYHAHQRQPMSRRRRENAQLIQEIRRIHTESDGVYGSPELWQELQGQRYGYGKHRVAQFMKQEALQEIQHESIGGFERLVISSGFNELFGSKLRSRGPQ